MYRQILISPSFLKALEYKVFYFKTIQQTYINSNYCWLHFFKNFAATCENFQKLFWSKQTKESHFLKKQQNCFSLKRKYFFVWRLGFKIDRSVASCFVVFFVAAIAVSWRVLVLLCLLLAFSETSQSNRFEIEGTEKSLKFFFQMWGSFSLPGPDKSRQRR